MSVIFWDEFISNDRMLIESVIEAFKKTLWECLTVLKAWIHKNVGMQKELSIESEGKLERCFSLKNRK